MVARRERGARGFRSIPLAPRVALRWRGLIRIRLMTRPAKLMGTENMHMHDFRRGSRRARSLGILAATITFVAARPASADLMLDFANDRPDATPAPGVPAVPAYITFTGSRAFDATADIDGVEEPAHALADIEPTAAAGRSLVDRADAISESLLHIRHLPFPLRK